MKLLLINECYILIFFTYFYLVTHISCISCITLGLPALHSPPQTICKVNTIQEQSEYILGNASFLMLLTPQMSFKILLCALPTQVQCSLKTSSVPYFVGMETKRRQHCWPAFIYRSPNAQLNWPNSQKWYTITSATPRRKIEKLWSKATMAATTDFYKTST